VPRVEAVPIHASSGTTGRPTVVGYAKRDVEIWAEVCARSIRAAGGRPGDLVHVVYGYGLFIADHRRIRLLNRSPGRAGSSPTERRPGRPIAVGRGAGFVTASCR
jgi:phenylacetate-coenzyme A ligase PaaK-like adenylate-forming protein